MEHSPGKLICCVCGAELGPAKEWHKTSDFRAACPGCISSVREPRHRDRLERLRTEEIQEQAPSTRQAVHDTS